MTADEFIRWIEEMKAAGMANSDADCARLLGVHPNTMSNLKAGGADQRTALACRAVLHRLKPYGAKNG